MKAKLTPREKLLTGEVVDLDGRQLCVSSMPDGTVCRDYRNRIAVRNVLTHRLSYIPEWKLLKNKTSTRAIRQEARKKR